MDFPFAPRTVGEIGKLEWFKLEDLPISRRQQAEVGSNVNFFLLFPFVRNLRNYVLAAKSFPASAAAADQEVGLFEASLNIQSIFGGRWLTDGQKLEKRDRELNCALGRAMYYEVLPVFLNDPNRSQWTKGNKKS